MIDADNFVGDIKTLPAGVVYLDHSGAILFFNQCFQNWVGRSEDIKGQHFSEFLSGAARIFNLTHIQPALTNTGHIEEMFLQLKSAKGELISVVLNAKRTHEWDVFVFLPMKKRQRFESELMEARKSAEQSAKETTKAYAALEEVQLLLTEKNQQLEELASTDSLTGLHNRRYFKSTLEREIESLKHTGEPVSLVLLDIDHFKAINDNHGHDMGDQTLAMLGEVLSENMRQCEYVSRIGGEEFAVVLPQQNGEQALLFSERIRSIVESRSFPTGKLTVSLGVAEANINEHVQGLYMRADAALYQAKDAGRNRAVLSE